MWAWVTNNRFKGQEHLRFAKRKTEKKNIKIKPNCGFKFCSRKR